MPARKKREAMLISEAKRLQEVDRFSSENPRSVINMIPDGMRSKLLDHQIKYPHLFLMDEENLMEYLRGQAAEINTTDEILRGRFWGEYDAATGEGAPRMIMNRVYCNIIDNNTWDRYITRPEKMAWIMCTPSLADSVQVAHLTFSLNRIGSILRRSHLNKDGTLNVRVAALQFAIHKYIDERVNGASIQRIEQKTIQYAEHRMIMAEAQSITEESLNSRLRKLELAERKANHLPDPKDIPKDIIYVSKKE